MPPPSPSGPAEKILFVMIVPLIDHPAVPWMSGTDFVCLVQIWQHLHRTCTRRHYLWMFAHSTEMRTIWAVRIDNAAHFCGIVQWAEWRNCNSDWLLDMLTSSSGIIPNMVEYSWWLLGQWWQVRIVWNAGAESFLRWLNTCTHRPASAEKPRRCSQFGNGPIWTFNHTWLANVRGHYHSQYCWMNDNITNYA